MATHAAEIQRQMQASATARLLGSGDWISIEELARMCQRSPATAKTLIDGWMAEGRILSIHHGGECLYPTYALDARTGHQPQDGLRSVLEVLRGAGRDNWAIAWWLDSPNSYLNGRQPKNCLAEPMDSLLDAAQSEAHGIQHG